MSSKVRLVLIIVSLAALAIVLSPISPFSNSPSGNSSVFSEEPINETAIAPPEISQEDFDLCNSINDNVESIMVDVDESRMNSTREIAADLLLGEYCNRPALVHEISDLGYAGLGLVAYACDAANGKIGDAELRDSLADHRAIYCESAQFSIVEESITLRESLEGFRQDFITSLREDNSTSANTEFILSLETSVDGIVSKIDSVHSLVAAGNNYDAVKTLSDASLAFEDLLQRVESS